MTLKDGCLVATQVRFNFKVKNDPKKLACAAQVYEKKGMQGVLLTICLIPPFETITDNVSFLSAFGFEEKHI